MHSCCTVILSLTSRTELTHHAWLKNHGTRCQCICPRTFTLHRAMSCVTPHLMTPSTGTPSSLVLNSSTSTNPAGIHGHSRVALWPSPDPLHRKSCSSEAPSHFAEVSLHLRGLALPVHPRLALPVHQTARVPLRW